MTAGSCTRRAAGAMTLLALASRAEGARADEPTTPPPSSEVTYVPKDEPVPPPSQAAIVAPIPPARAIELGGSFGVVSRSSTQDSITYSAGVAYGGYVRTDLVSWLGARAAARVEKATASYSDPSLGIAGAHFEEADMTRVYLSFAVEPTWTPIDRLEVYGGVGLGWGRTVCPMLRYQSANGNVAEIPLRAAVFADFPMSLGVRYEVVKDWLVLQASGSVSILWAQTGSLLEPARTPGTDGVLTTAREFPDLGTSFSGLLGLGILL